MISYYTIRIIIIMCFKLLSLPGIGFWPRASEPLYKVSLTGKSQIGFWVSRVGGGSGGGPRALKARMVRSRSADGGGGGGVGRETKRTGGEGRGEFVISGPRIFELPSRDPRGELHPHPINVPVHVPFMCACVSECVRVCVCARVCVYTLYIIYIPSSPGPSGNSSLYDLVWPGRVSESPAATAQPRHGCTRRAVKFFLFLVARPVRTTSIRRPPQGFLEDPLCPPPRPSSFPPAAAAVVQVVAEESRNTPYTLDPIRTFRFACFQTVLPAALIPLLSSPLQSYPHIPTYIYTYIFPSTFFLYYTSTRLSCSASFLSPLSFFLLTTRFFSSPNYYTISDRLVVIPCCVRIMFLKSKQTVQTCRIRKYISFHTMLLVMSLHNLFLLIAPLFNIAK